MAETALLLLSKDRDIIPHHQFQERSSTTQSTDARTEGQCLAGEHSPVCIFEPNFVSAASVRRRCVTQLALSESNTVLLSSTGDILAGGANDEGQLGPAVAEAAAISSPKVIDIGSSDRLVQVACGHGFAFTVTSGRAAISWGINESGQLGHSSECAYNVIPRMVQGMKCPVVQVAAGAQHALLLGSNGCVYGLGSNACTQLGMSGRFKRDNPTLIASLIGVPVRFVASGDFHSVAVDAGGSVFSWGRNKYLQCGQGSEAKACLPKRIDTGTFSILSAACGSGHTVLVSRSGRLLAFGHNAAGQCGVSGPAREPGTEGKVDIPSAQMLGEACLRPTDVGSIVANATLVGGALQLESVRQVSCGSRHTLALTAGGDVYAFGENTSGQLGLGMSQTMRFVPSPVKVSSVSGCGAFLLAASGETSGLVRVSEGRVVSYPVGTLPFGTMIALDSTTFNQAATAAVSSGRTSALRQLVSGIFASPSTLGGSFLLPMIEPKCSSGANIVATGTGRPNDEPLAVVRQAAFDDGLAHRLGLISTYPKSMLHPDFTGLPHLRVTKKRSELRPTAWTPSAAIPRERPHASGALTPDGSSTDSTRTASAFAKFLCESHGRICCLPWEQGSSSADSRPPTSSIPPAHIHTAPVLAPTASGAGDNLNPADFFNLRNPLPTSTGGQHHGAFARQEPIAAASSLNLLLKLHSFLDVTGIMEAYKVALSGRDIELAASSVWSAVGTGLRTLEPIARGVCEAGPVRCLMVYLLCPLLQKPTALSAQVYTGILSIVSALPYGSKLQLASWLVADLSVSVLRKSILQPALKFLSHFLRIALTGRSGDAVLVQSLDPEERLAHLGGQASGIKVGESGALKASQVSVAECVDLTMNFLGLLWEACTAVLSDNSVNWSHHDDYYEMIGSFAAADTSNLVDTSPLSLLQMASQQHKHPNGEGTSVRESIELAFHSDQLSEMPDALLSRDFQRWRVHGFCRQTSNAAFASFPFLLSPSCKRRYLQLESSLQMQATMQLVMARSLFVPNQSPYFLLNVRRDRLIEDAATGLAQCSLSEMKKPLRVHFIGEDGVDAGGLKREFFHLVCEEFLSGKYGLFVENEADHSLYFNPAATAMVSEYALLGKLVGLAVFNGVLLDLNFSRVLYGKLLGQQPGFLDLGFVNRQLFAGLRQLIEYPGEDVAEIFCIDFTASFSFFGHTQTVNLVPNGADIPVTAANKHHYVVEFSDWYLNRSVATMFESFRAGFASTMSGHTLQMCTAWDLEQLVVGSTDLDMTALKVNTTYEGGLNADSRSVKWLWEIIFSLNPAAQKLFLKFVTGTDRAPIGGLSRVNLIVQGNGPDSDALPSSSTCFNILLLPDYSSKEKLQTKLEKAICEGSAGFGLQ